MKGGNIINIIQVGAGGTGGHVVHFLAPFLHNFEYSINYTLIDGDIVELRNTLRQNFCAEDVDQYKSQVLGNKYDVNYLTQFLDSSLLEDCLDESKDNLILGCVDKVAVRLEIDDFLIKNRNKYNSVYIDGGNTATSAQVIIYDYIANKGVNITNYFKDIIDEDNVIASCSEMGDQTIQANLMSATYIVNNAIFYIEKQRNTKRQVFKNYEFIIAPRMVSMLGV